ncbi:uncharacterized protein N7473_004349 [Penicillium subrubescens]|uniref:uncharacterized protein n=1 Tax=Penicillium subrubescens TaxID=1316194 RepID=UPI0025454F98|nr:uncharacterized protein N7473_004349 [Penicillium subrubescens]KAJ5900279.1 hypothetical protein N7473_004349 [Penicillium subrubescens]
MQAQAHAADTANYFAARANKDQTGKRPSRPSRRGHTPKVITGRPKTLCLPHLGKIDDITSALLIRRESPWDTYRPVLTYNGAGHVTIATRRSRPSRVLEHKNVLSLLECYLDGDSAFVLVDDLALTLGHIVACPNLRPAEFELGCLMAQVLAGASYLSAFGLTQPFLKCHDILFGLDGVVKIARLEECVDCTTSQAETTYIAAVPSIVMELMIPTAQNGIASDTSSGSPSEANIVQFLNATRGESSLTVLRQQPLVSERYQTEMTEVHKRTGFAILSFREY